MTTSDGTGTTQAGVDPEVRVWERYVAIGDSFTEGLMDATEVEDEFAGWADRLAARLAREAREAGRDFGYANLAVRGRLMNDIVGDQLDAALELTPDLVSLSAGGNDLLRPKVTIRELAGRLEDAVTRLRDTGADVLLLTAPDNAATPIVGRVSPRMAELTAHIWGIGQRHGCYVVDLWTRPDLADPRMYAPDRIHFNELGHRRVADQAAWTLGLGTEDLESLPAADPLTRLASLQANREWARTHLAPWVNRHLHGRSSGDGRSAKRPAVAPVEFEI